MTLVSFLGGVALFFFGLIIGKIWGELAKEELIETFVKHLKKAINHEDCENNEIDDMRKAEWWKEGRENDYDSY